MWQTCKPNGTTTVACPGYWHDFVGMNQRRNYIKRNLYKAAFVVLLLGALPVSSAASIGGYFIPGGMYGGESGYHYWENYCPLCHHYGGLVVNPKGTYEGEITCSYCDADYDGCTGYDKYEGGARAKLIPAVVEKEEPENVNAQSTEQPAATPETNNTTSTANKTVNSSELTSKSLVPVANQPDATVTVKLGVDNVLVNNTVLQAHLKSMNEHWLVI
ncbi:MAG: hypothetical protein ACC609_06135 [Methanobacterium formicicum]